MNLYVDLFHVPQGSMLILSTNEARSRQQWYTCSYFFLIASFVFIALDVGVVLGGRLEFPFVAPSNSTRTCTFTWAEALHMLLGAGVFLLGWDVDGWAISILQMFSFLEALLPPLT